MQKIFFATTIALLLNSAAYAAPQAAPAVSPMRGDASRVAQVLVKNAAEISNQMTAQELTGAQVQSGTIAVTSGDIQVVDYEFSLAFPLKQGMDPACRIENGTLSIVLTWNMQTDARSTVVTVKQNPTGCSGPL